MTGEQIKVLVVDDSSTTRKMLVHLLESDPHVSVIGVVNDGQAAVDFVQQSIPDVILMDIHMPRMDGFEATRRIMETQPVPIIICSASMDANEIAISFRMQEAGAVACVEKPGSPSDPRYEGLVSDFLQTVKLMAEVKVIRRWPRSQRGPSSSAASDVQTLKQSAFDIQMIGIGSSTGGPVVLQSILTGLPKNFPVPILIVQHIAKGFLPGLVNWLNQTTGYKIEIGAHGVIPLPSHAYVAPDDVHMGIADGQIQLTHAEPENHLRPAVSYLFRSLAEAYGPKVLGVLLTGMGRDGADELKAMKDAGSITIAQDRESSVVYGMPGVAIALGGATYVLPADKIADALITLVKKKN